MNELALSNDINIITAEINSYKQVAGQAIFEIGKRLKHVKEKDLAHGEFGKWLESIEIDWNTANRFMKIAKELDSNSDTYQNLGWQAMYLISTLPEEEREKTHTIPSTGEEKQLHEMTIKELKEVKDELKKVKTKLVNAEKEKEQIKTEKNRIGQLLKEARNRSPEVVEKEIIKEVLVEVVPQKLKDELKNKDRWLAALKNEAEKMKEEIKGLKIQQENEDEDDERLEKQQKRLEREANIETLEIVVNINNFLKETSLSSYQFGAIANSNESTRKRIQETVSMLKQFTSNLEVALNGRIKIKEEV